jgi:hypothetical protein
MTNAAFPAACRSGTEPAAPRSAVRTVLDQVTEQPPAPLPVLSELRHLVQDAADRAAALLAGTAPRVLDPVADLARFAASRPGLRLDDACERLGLTLGQMDLAVRAYRIAGADAVAVLLAAQLCARDVFNAAARAVGPLRPYPLTDLTRQDNRLIDSPARVQLRYGPDERWHPYTQRGPSWQPEHGVTQDPAAAYRAARSALRLTRRPG